MSRRPLLWTIFPTFFIITLIGVVGVGVYTTGSLRSFAFQQTSIDLQGQTHIVKDQVRGILLDSTNVSLQKLRLDSLCAAYSKLAPARLTIFSPNGDILADSYLAVEQRRNESNREEIREALATGMGEGLESGDDELSRFIAVAETIQENTRVYGIVRLAMPTTFLRERMSQMYLQLVLGGFIVLILMGIASLIVARKIIHPIDSIKRGAERFAQGDLDSRLPVPDSEEIGSLAELMNAMSAQLSDRIRAVTSQRNEQEAILSSMVEGVVAVDREDRILTINQAAGKILGVDSLESIGRPIQEVIRVSQLAILADRSRQSGVPVEEDFQVSGKENDTYLQAHANVLRDGRGAIIGTVIVLNDMTRIRQLENIRREFVANVSHELRTPLTLVKGYVETILESGVDSPEDTERFIRIISRHVDRLNNIIEDLLSLSRIEQSSDHDEISLQKGQVAEIADQVIEIQRSAAAERRITIRNLCPPDLIAKFSHSLLEQALLNLVDNAVKYSPDGSTVSISASSSDGMVAVQVTDNGPGISTEHHGRIFERFYRVDRGRSRDLGGTGLGLAIVKHIAIAMGGRVAVDSAPGKGSTFTIFLNAG